MVCNFTCSLEPLLFTAISCHIAPRTSVEALDMLLLLQNTLKPGTVVLFTATTPYRGVFLQDIVRTLSGGPSFQWR